MIEVTGLKKRYGKKEIIKGVSLQLASCTYGLVGPNGAGKTTLIRMLAGVLQANGGEISMNQKKENIGYLPQKFGCFPELTVSEQMEYFACLKDIPKSQHKKEIMRVIEIVNMSEMLKMKCRKLSGGMIRRIGIAQALLGNPILLLLDEPTVGLDPEERNNFNNIIRNLEGKITILLSTHLVEDIKYLCQKVIIMESGKILKSADAEEISSLASGRVYKIPERKLMYLSEPYYVENYFTQNGEKYVKVLILGNIGDMEEDSYCKADIEDGYLFILKNKGLHK